MSSRVILDPTSEQKMASCELLARPTSISGQRIGLLDIFKDMYDHLKDKPIFLFAQKKMQTHNALN